MYCPDSHSVFTAPPGEKVSDMQFGGHVDPCHSDAPDNILPHVQYVCPTVAYLRQVSHCTAFVLIRLSCATRLPFTIFLRRSKPPGMILCVWVFILPTLVVLVKI